MQIKPMNIIYVYTEFHNVYSNETIMRQHYMFTKIDTSSQYPFNLLQTIFFKNKNSSFQ